MRRVTGGAATTSTTTNDKEVGPERAKVKEALRRLLPLSEPALPAAAADPEHTQERQKATPGALRRDEVMTMPTTPNTHSDEVAEIIAGFAAQMSDPAGPFAMVVRFQVQTDAHQRVQAAFATARPLTLAEHGARLFEVHRDPQDITRFVIYECWDSLGDLEAHLRSKHVALLRRVIDAALAGVPQFQVLVPVA